ncbi:MAG: hypothetical protein EOR40_14365 [Mesorhizobium sp.]|nr:MAG: hypothetical protein EOR40_14365 [Mesorhizobium sp.]
MPSRPLCPAGHLAHEGGDWTPRLLSPIFDGEEKARRQNSRSPQVGEMSGRTEGGAVPPASSAYRFPRAS